MRTWKVILSALALMAAGIMAINPAGAEGVAKSKAKTSSMVVAEPAPQPYEWIPSWNGIFVGVHGGVQSGLADLSLDHSKAGNLASINGLGFDRDLVGGINAGASWRIKGTPLVLIAMASYEWGDTPFDISAGGTSILSATVTPTWKAGGAVGWLLTNNAMVYAGYQYAEGELSVSSPFFTTFSKDLTGYNIPVGIEVPWTEQIKVGLQYDFTRYDSVNLASFGCGNGSTCNLNTEIETQAVTMRLKLDLTSLFK